MARKQKTKSKKQKCRPLVGPPTGGEFLSQVHAHEVLVAKGLHAHGALALAGLNAILDALAADDVAAHGDDGVLDVTAAVAVYHRLPQSLALCQASHTDYDYYSPANP